MAEEQTFETYIEKERVRIEKERQTKMAQLRELEEAIAVLQREMDAIDAYEQVKQGKSLPTRRTTGARRSGIREQVLTQVQRKPASRAEIIESLGMKGDKASEQSISNALSALKKAGKVKQEGDGKYAAA